MIGSAFIYRALAEKKTRENTLLGGAKGGTEKLGPLKVVLGKIPGVFADRTVHLQQLDPRIVHLRSDEEANCPAPSGIRCFHRRHYRRLGRMQGQRTGLCDPVHPWAICG